MATGNLLERVRRVALSLPDTEESSRLGGEPHFYVGGKIFAGCGQEGGTWVLGVKVGLELQSLLITRPGFRIAKYVGRYGWVSADAEALADQAELERLVQLSYGLITGSGTTAPARPRTKPRAKRTAKKAKKAPKPPPRRSSK